MNNTKNQRSASKLIEIKPVMLLAVYASIFLAVGLVAFDFIFLNSRLQNSLPADPNVFIWFTIIFTLPHILASFFSFFDTEYVKEYGDRLLRGAQLSIVAAIILPLISIEFAFYVFAVFTMIHVLFQQSGVAKSLMRGANSKHKLWQWCGALIAGILYIAIYSDVSLSNPFVIAAISILTVIFSFLAIIAGRASKTRIGSYYFWMTHATVLSVVFFYVIGYPILSIAVPRIVHDFTAYIYYTSHDHNRFRKSQTNILYRFTSMLGLPVLFVSIAFSIGLAAILQTQLVYSATLPLISVIILMHYHTESYIWKRGSLHRRYISYSE